MGPVVCQHDNAKYPYRVAQIADRKHCRPPRRRD